MPKERIQQEAISPAEFWEGIEPARMRADLYGTMTLYDARTDQVIVLEENHVRYWTFVVAGHPGEVFSQPTYFLCRMLEIK
jgi:predicted double-glycine peptidase